MDVYVPQRESDSPTPERLSGKSGRPSLEEILQTCRGGRWSAPLQLKNGSGGVGMGWGEPFAGNDGGEGVLQAYRGKGEASEDCRTNGSMGGEQGVVQAEMQYCKVGVDVCCKSDLEALNNNEYRLYWPEERFEPRPFTEPEMQCVNMAMKWGREAKEGIAGWIEREYSPKDFMAIVKATNRAIERLSGNVPLDNENNRTLIAIRAFRSADGSMANGTLDELKEVLRIVSEKGQPCLSALGLLAPRVRLVSIEAELGEAHPNTLPTARVVFIGGTTFYFKGRAGFVEGALVGTNSSAALNLSALGAAGFPVGSHSFFGNDQTHMAGMVGGVGVGELPGADVVEEGASGHELEGEGAEAGEMGEVGGISKEDRAVRAWVSAVKTAVLAAVTGSGDMHKFNLKRDDADGVHLIDAEFLLDVTLWDTYANSITAHSFYNMDWVISLDKPYLSSLLRDFSGEEIEKVKGRVVEEFEALGLGGEGVLDRVLEPIRKLLKKEELLRVMPRGTDVWLRSLTDYNTVPKLHDFDGDWGLIKTGFDQKSGSIQVEDRRKRAVCSELGRNYKAGMVPLFHVKSASGEVYMNKVLRIGQVKPGRLPADFLEFLKTSFVEAVQNGYITNLIQQIFDGMRPPRG